MIKQLSIHSTLQKELRINQGLLNNLKGAADDFRTNPKDAEKAKEALAALQDCRARLAKLLADSERILRSSKGITRHTVDDPGRSSLHGMRGNLDGHTRKFIDEVRFQLGRTDAAIGLVKGMNAKPGEALKSALEMIEDLSSAIKKWEGGSGGGHIGVPGWEAPKQAQPDLMSAVSTVLVLLAALMAKRMERAGRDRS